MVVFLKKVRKPKKTFIMIFTLIFLILPFLNVSAEIPDYQINTSPDLPTSGSSISFNVSFNNSSFIEKVRLQYHECSKDFVCSKNKYVTLNLSGSNKYTGEIDLSDKTAIYMEYLLEVTINGSAESKKNWTKITLQPVNIENMSDSDNKKESPGIKFAIIFLTLLSIAFYIKKVRKK